MDARERWEERSKRKKGCDGRSGPGRRQASFSNPLPQSTVDQDLPSFRERTGLKQGSKVSEGVDEEEEEVVVVVVKEEEEEEEEEEDVVEEVEQEKVLVLVLELKAEQQGRGRKPILPTVEEGRAKKVRGDEKRFSKPTAEGGREGGKEARGLPSIRGAGKEDNPPSKHSARSRGQLSELGARRKMLR
eukprot:766054-Hanusia_phi.AAC.3